MRRLLLLIIAAVAVLAALLLALWSQQHRPIGRVATILVASPAFANGSFIPANYTCDGADVSPPLRWSGVPQDAKALLVAVVDVDAPGGYFVHWVLYNIPPNVTSLPSNIPKQPIVKYGEQGTNDFGKIGYGGPCPPPGPPHRYIFIVLALDSQLDVQPGASDREILSVASSHVVASGEIVGLYGR